MAIIQPNEIDGLPELFEEVKALRREIELLKFSSKPASRSELQATDPHIPDGLVDRAEEADDHVLISMAPEDIRERVGEVVGERSDGAQPLSVCPATS